MRLFCPTIVGRRAESGAVAGQLVAVANGTGQSVFLLGAAGMGKTRLAREVERDALERGMLVMRGRAAPSVQYRPLTEALLGVLRRFGPPDTPELAPYRAALSRLAPDWGMTRVPGIDDSPIVLAEAVLRLLARLARDNGCLLVLEDLHDADADTLMIVEYLVDNLAHEPVALIGTTRPGGDAATMAYAAEQRHNATVLRLDPLGGDAVREMVAACLGVPAAAVPQDALDQLLPASAGVPFFVEELLSAMVDEGLLIRQGGRWQSTGAARLPISEAMRASVLARAKRLDPAGRQVVQMAAVYGQPCPAALLAAGTGLGAAELSDALKDSVNTQLLMLDDRADRYRILHALVGEVLRAAIPPADRAGLSRRAAAAIERTFPGLPADWCVLAGTLWQQAGEPERAAQLFHRAGRRAAEQGAVRTAIALLEQGLNQLDGDGSASTAQLVEALLELLVVAGDLPRARELGASWTGTSPRNSGPAYTCGWLGRPSLRGSGSPVGASWAGPGAGSPWPRPGGRLCC